MLFGMEGRRYTLKEVSEILSLSFADQSEEQCSRKIRHWTLADLLEPYGSKHTGTGKSREYLVEEIRKAALLMELSRWRLPIPFLTDSFGVMLDSYEDGEEWQTALDGSENVFLSLSWNEDLVNWQMSVGEPSLTLVTNTTHSVSLSDSYEMQLPSSAIVLNVTRIFQSLNV